MAFAAAYCEEMDRWSYRLDWQKENAGSWRLSACIEGETVHVYFGFISAKTEKKYLTVILGNTVVVS